MKTEEYVFTGMTKVRTGDTRDGWYEITPLAARLILEGRAKNRPLKKRMIARISADIQSSQFRANGESIVFDVAGCLIDGQNRMQACVLANSPMITFCVFGVSNEMFSSFDQGSQRGFDDIASIIGFSNAVQIAAISRLIITCEESSLASRSKHVVSKDRMRLFLESNHQQLQFCATQVLRLVKGIRPFVPVSHAGFLYFQTVTRHPELTPLFWESLASGEGLKKGDPLLVFRQRMLSATAIDMTTRLAMLIKTWNVTVDGKTLGVLRWSPDEGFPSVR